MEATAKPRVGAMAGDWITRRPASAPRSVPPHDHRVAPGVLRRELRRAAGLGDVPLIDDLAESKLSALVHGIQLVDKGFVGPAAHRHSPVLGIVRSRADRPGRTSRTGQCPARSLVRPGH